MYRTFCVKLVKMLFICHVTICSAEQINFPRTDNWNCKVDELEIVPDAILIKPGEKVNPCLAHAYTLSLTPSSFGLSYSF